MSSADWALTGAGGQVGGILREGLRPRVRRLRLLDLQMLSADPPVETPHSVDIQNRDALTDAIAGADGVVHLAAIGDEAELRTLLDTNVAGTHNVLEAARRAGVPRVVLASTNHVTGMYPADTPVGVESPVRPDSLYAVSKIATEALGRLYADKFGLEVACLRIGSCLRAPTEPRHKHTWLSHRDTVAAFWAAMRTPDLAFAIFYAVSANRECWWDLTPGTVLGFQPVDDASTVRSRQSLSDYCGAQGGEFAKPAYTLHRTV